MGEANSRPPVIAIFCSDDRVHGHTYAHLCGREDVGQPFPCVLPGGPYLLLRDESDPMLLALHESIALAVKKLGSDRAILVTHEDCRNAPTEEEWVDDVVAMNTAAAALVCAFPGLSVECLHQMLNGEIVPLPELK